MFTRTYELTSVDALALARAAGLSVESVAIRLDLTPRRVQQMARDPRHARRVRLAVYELLAERERLEALFA